MDFFQIREKLETRTYEDSLEKKRYKVLEIYPDFKACRSKDLMIRGRAFYAIWDEEKNLWSTDEYDVQRLVDKKLDEYKKERAKTFSGEIDVRYMLYFSSNMWKNYRAFLREMSDCSIQLDEKITFLDTEVKKEDYISRRLPYRLEQGSIAAYEELIGTLYSPTEKAKLEWAIGAIIAGDAKNIQKFIVLYGEAGSGKSTVLNIIQKIFEGYYTTFEAKALTSSTNTFSTETFRNNPLVAIQHDGDLSRIEDNTKLNSLISHEEMTMNEKYKASYTARSNAFLFMGTNKPVKITDAKSGIIRRLIDVIPSGQRVSTQRYHILMSQIEFELGAIASHCLDIYRSMGKNYYSGYKPLEMMFKTDVFFNFVEDSFYIFKEQNGVSLSQAYEMYKQYCEETLVEFKLPKYKFREELKSYFEEFHDRIWVDGKQYRSYYSGFMKEKFAQQDISDQRPYSLMLEHEVSLLDDILKDCQAQYATLKETPKFKWTNVETTLADINTKEIHFVRPPENHIVIDFDLKDISGNKSLELNLAAASKWPATYAEFSKSGAGLHLHYIYEGDTSRLSRIFSENIEIKVFTGQASLRRKLTKCNDIPITTLTSGLPLKGEKMINFDVVKSEQNLRRLIEKCLRKEHHGATKPEIDFIHKILEDAYNSELKYDVTDMRSKILIFANNSTNQAEYCIKLVQEMKFSSEEASVSTEKYEDDTLIFYDVEVFPNLLVVVWKREGGQKVTLINPTSSEIEELFRFKLVGFNCRRYDNHILYARYIGYDISQIYQLSQKIVNNSRSSFFREAYNISYTDVYDFISEKKSLKKFQIELGIHHQELGLPWDKEVPEELWNKVAEYCGNDVDATEAVFHAKKDDFMARLILADLSGLTPNDSTQSHTAKIIFGNDKNPQESFVYTDLSEEFPGYSFDAGKSLYRDEVPGEGGYVYAEPGMYTNVAVLDIASMHPTSLVYLNLFGKYTSKFKELLDARIAIKHKEFDLAKTMLGGILERYLTSDGDSGALSYALKIVINIVYGLTSAKFDNKFRDPRNKDNIVAKRGALFMIDLKNAVQEKGYNPIHIKTDSIKIPDATPEIIKFIFEFGEKYGYTFEHEATYSKMCLVNESVYISKYTSIEKSKELYGYVPNDIYKYENQWSATGAQFAQPYVFKTLFSHEPIIFDDLYEVKSVTTALYLDMNESLPEGEHDYVFIGKTGAFCPIQKGKGGGILLREKDEKYHAATGTKGYRWLEAEMVKELNKEADIDRSYYNILVDEAIYDISKFGDAEWFINAEVPVPVDRPPWCDIPCEECSHYVKGQCTL